MSVKVGSFTKATGTGAQAVTGVSFVPKALILWTTRQTSAGQTDIAFLSFGFSDGTNDRCSALNWRDASGLQSDTSQAFTDTAILRLITNNVGSTSVDAEATLTSFDADGFTLNWSSNDGVASLIHYMAIGGEATAFAGSFNSPSTGGSGQHAYTGVGFQPDMILFLCPDQDQESDSDFTALSSVFTIGAADADGNQWLSSAQAGNAGNGGRAYQTTSLCAALLESDSSIDEQASIVSMDADGFTLNWSVVAGNPNVCFYLALGNVEAKVGSLTQPTSTGTQATTGTGFTPDAVMFVSQNKAASAVATDTGRMSIGAGDGTSQGCAWIGMLYPAANAPSARSHNVTNALRTLTEHATGSSSVLTSEASLSSLHTNGFTANWTTVDSTQRQWLWFAIKALGENETGVVIEVGDPPVEINPLRWTFNILATANGPDTMTCDIESDLNTSPVQRFSVFDPIAVYLDGERVFAGIATGVQERGFAGPNHDHIVIRITAGDYSTLAQRRYITTTVAAGSPATTLSDFLQDEIITDLLDDYGVTLHPSQDTGPNLGAFDFSDRVLASTALDRIAESLGRVWGIDYDKQLRMWAPGDIAAPFNLVVATDDPANHTGDVEVERTLNDRYANRVLVVGAKITQLGRVEVFTGDGAETQFQPDYQILAVPQGVIEVEGGSIPVGDRRWETITIEGGDDAQWHYNTTTNTITRFESSTSAVEEPLESGQTATFTFDGEFTPFAQADDVAEQTANGIVEYVERINVVADDDAAQTIADAILAERKTATSAKVTYSTRSAGLLPGQTQTITIPERDVSGTFLITDVNTSVVPGDIDDLLRTVTAVENQSPAGNWREFYKDLAPGAGSTSSATVTGGTGSSAFTGILGGRVLTADPGSPIDDDTWWVMRDGGSPETVYLKAQVGGQTVEIASAQVP